MLEEVARAADLQKDGQWITYLIRDPRYPDKRGNEGTPIYVGQTNDFRGRVLSRFNKCEKEAIEKGKDCIERRVADLLHLEIVPTYQVLDYQPTRLSSLVSETNWARECWDAGYHLANQKRLQNKGGDEINRSQIPEDWLWEFNLEEAITDDIRAVLLCEACGDELPIPLPTVGARDIRPRTLGDMRQALEAEACFACQIKGKRRVKLKWN
jgi:hypothetical protein